MATSICRHLGLVILLLISFSSGRSFSHRETRWKFYEEFFGVDPDDRIDVERWNQMNDEDLQRMPKIDDFSDERAAMRWFRWNSRIAERYRQVKKRVLIRKRKFSHLDRRTSPMELSHKSNERKSTSDQRSKLIKNAVSSFSQSDRKEISSIVDQFDE